MMKTYKILLTSLLVLVSSLGFSQSVPSYVPTSGLVGWWGFNGNAQDGSGNGNHGTVNGATLTTDRFGISNSAYYFYGNSRIENNNNSLRQVIDGINPFSVTMWFMRDSSGNTGGAASAQAKVLWAFDGNNVYPYKRVWATIGQLNNSTTQIQFTRTNTINGSPEVVYNTNTFVQPNTWHFLSIIFNGNNVLVYLNNIQLSSIYSGNPVMPISLLGPDNHVIGFTIGDNNQNNVANFSGILDDIGIWNRALTQQEITNLYNSQLPTQTSLCLPTITTTSPSSVGVDSVVIGGNITNDGGSSIVLRGFCYSTTPNPNMGNQRTEDGSGTGSFNTVLRGLTSSTTYYARSYAKNSNGVVVYGNEVSFTTSSITIGSNYAGGIIFYIDQTGQHGLVCAPFDQGTAPWGLYGVDVPGTSSSFGTGAQNTAAIVAYSQSGYGALNPASAALMCDTLSLNGYTDWYLPSQYELFTLHSVLHANSNNIGGFSNQWYWSSSNCGADVVSPVYFDGGSTNYLQCFHKNMILGVRAIRSFYIGTSSNQPAMPTVTTNPVTLLPGNSASTGGNVTSDGGSPVTHRGVVYDTTSNPSLSSNYTVDGSGAGPFVSTLTNLASTTTYYTRAYATNSVGTAYGSVVSFSTNLSIPTVSIGQNYAGGIVFYIDQTGQHGLVCAPFDQGTAPWGLYGVDVPGTSSSFGTGAQNTAAIVAYSQSGYGALNPASAALMCDTLSLNGYTDWYLPSQYELFTLHSVLHANSNNIGGFSNQWYWSSSQGDFQNVSVVLFDGGSTNYLTSFHKNSIQPVRAIRSF